MSEKQLTYLISVNGTISDYSKIMKMLPPFNACISVDGGIRHLNRMGIIPTAAIGDFDSLGDFSMESFDASTEIIKFPQDKDATDTELAVDYAVKKNANSIILIGYWGSRLDHSLSNIFLLSRIPASINVELIDEKNRIYRTSGHITLVSGKSSYVSVLPITPEVTVSSSEGLLYDLTGKTLLFGSSLSVSNRSVKNTFSITVQNGTALIFISED